MNKLGFMNRKTTVDEIIAGEYSSLSDAQPFLPLLSIYGWHYMGLIPPNGPFSFVSTNHLGDILKIESDIHKERQRDIISNFLSFIDELVKIYNDQFSLSSLKKNTLGLFTCRVAANLFCNGFVGFNPSQKLPPADDEQKFKHIASLINDYTFRQDKDFTIRQNARNEIPPLFSSDLETKKVCMTNGLVNWFNGEKIKEYAWLPLQGGDEEIAKWCWGRIKALQEKEKIPLAYPPLAAIDNSYKGPFEKSSARPFVNTFGIVSELESACGDQYQLAVYAYFCFVGDPFTRDMVRNKVAGLYRAKKFKGNSKGRILNVIVSDKCKDGLDRLTKHHNKKQADILSELIEKACKEISEQE